MYDMADSNNRRINKLQTVKKIENLAVAFS